MIASMHLSINSSRSYCTSLRIALPSLLRTFVVRQMSVPRGRARELCSTPWTVRLVGRT
jgi:hypothetical protein